ncbi:9797_t:CDS:2 [Funneliformis mosseae]|uniref:9797_t:CDS:1 n=1 Tax=Funneliformis mosseae TaxID=27381 RepID=A0A9N9B237_FUNMO|nr:9797_t:CDS:2 [Funneliformis mosseae]
MSFSLNCLFLGETSFDKIFPIIVPDKIIVNNAGVPINRVNIGHFKRYIWSINKAKFNFDDPDVMKLWKVNIDEESKLGVFTEDGIKDNLGGTKMLPQKFLKEYSPKELDSPENVHIMIVVPTAGSSQQGVPQGTVSPV